MSARASRARSAGHTPGGGVFSLMPSGWQWLTSADLDVSELLHDPGGRRAAGQLSEFPVQVRLVEIAAGGRQLSQPEWLTSDRAPLQDAPGPVEPHHAGCRLGR